MDKKEEKKEEGKEEGEIKKDRPVLPPRRQIIISTDGNDVKIEKAEVSGSLELTAILQSLLNFINKSQ
ncbi:MAG TPA: hypothetical protein ENH99_01440 [Candidatus Pacearchaeota archaeon]|nr:hypothetical protein [Candidatus Pacearchaeota archaeon]